MADIVSTPDVLGGAPRIEGRRIGVHHVAKRVIDAAEAPEQVAADHGLDIADVHRALAYYYDYPEEMRAVRAERRTVPDGLRVVRGPDDLESANEPDPKREAARRRTRAASVGLGTPWRGPRRRDRRRRRPSRSRRRDTSRIRSGY